MDCPDCRTASSTSSLDRCVTGHFTAAAGTNSKKTASARSALAGGRPVTDLRHLSIEILNAPWHGLFKEAQQGFFH